MDFPDVSLVLQVGLPSDADCYTHRKFAFFSLERGLGKTLETDLE